MPDLPVDIQQQIDRLCDEFERTCEMGESHRIEKYLNQLPAELQPLALRELLALEIELVARRKHVDVDEYLGRFPRHRNLVLELLGPYSKNSSPPIPSAVGRYVIQSLLGEGNFGRVFLAQDPELDRLVAIKVPTLRVVPGRRAESDFMNEARNAAKLKHPFIVTIHDVHSDSDGPYSDGPYIVQEYVDGVHLDVWWQKNSGPWESLVRLLLEIVNAVGYAHQRDIYHRDLKPSNVIVDLNGHAHVADFGLAIHENSKELLQGQVSGSPAYMSPEQVRGETHRIDGTTDIWSLGVIMYELLAGRRPFRSQSIESLFVSIQDSWPRSPRQINPAIPVELERVCLRCLEKAQRLRYGSCAELHDDLVTWLTSDADRKGSAAVDKSDAGRNSDPVVIPRGLRAFEPCDADFYVDLLPGPRDRARLPESIRFWKSRIEEVEIDNSFGVGVIYGPSGSGKSSFVRAGLIPRLATRITSMFIEATPNDTEVRLLRTIARHWGDVTGQASLPEVFRRLREDARGNKIVIFIDQFEQWLHGNPSDESCQLIDALRQCDGVNLQTIVLVRDDFWMSLTRFMHRLEFRLIEGENSNAIDTFSLHHAEYVLTLFGRAFNAITTTNLSAAQNEFIKKSVASLADKGKVVSVRLALFAEMIKNRPWTAASLREVGGPHGIGVTFFEESFCLPTAPPEHRLHQQAARQALEALLPDPHSDIKGAMRSREVLLKASGYASKPREFDALLRLLDQQLRLITPTDPDGLPENDQEPRTNRDRAAFYQLTHDYLVPSLREWVTQKRRESRRGRAELHFNDRLSLWKSSRNDRNLPTLAEYLTYALFVARDRRSTAGSTMMRRATRSLAVRWGTILLGVTLVLVAGERWMSSRIHESQMRELRTAVTAMQNLRGNAVPLGIRELERYPRDPVIRELVAQLERSEPSRRLAIACALSHFGTTDVDYLIKQVRTSASEDAGNLIAALRTSSAVSLERIQSEIRHCDDVRDWSLKTRIAITAMYLGEYQPAIEMARIGEDPSQRVQFINVLPTWHGPLNELVSLAEAIEDPSLRTSLCVAIGSIPAVTWTPSDSAAWQQVVGKWYATAPDAGTHSASDWALRQWSLKSDHLSFEKTALAADDSETRDRQWYVIMSGITMLKLPGGYWNNCKPDDHNSKNQPEWIPPFHISNCEISRTTFDSFLNDTEYPQAMKPVIEEKQDNTYNPSARHPVVNLSAVDGFLFCNWLSRREGVTPSYVLGDEGWTLLPDTVGYRLPTEVEWEFACRAGTCYEHVTGDYEELLDRYAVIKSDTADVCGSRFPNAWGVFDMHGNAWEWAHHRSTGDQGRGLVLCGGGFGMSPSFVRATTRLPYDPQQRMTMAGFRVVRNQPSTSP